MARTLSEIENTWNKRLTGGHAKCSALLLYVKLSWTVEILILTISLE